MQKEAKARIKINTLLQQSGWHFFDDKAGRQNIEVENNVNLEILGDDFEHSMPLQRKNTAQIAFECCSGKSSDKNQRKITKRLLAGIKVI